MTTGRPDGGWLRLRDAMAARVAHGDLPGLVMLLARGDDVRVEAIGTFAVDGGAPMRRDTLFRIASLTKPIVAAAALALVEDGALDLAEPVDRLLPELAGRRVLARVDGPVEETVPARRPITVEDLLTYRMGFGILTEPTFDPPFPIVAASGALDLTLGPPDPRTPYAPDEWLRRFGTLPLMYQPGERWLYNASGLVLGVLVARAGGGSLGDVLRTRIFAPLSMVDTGFATTRANLARLPVPYMSDFQGGPLQAQTTTPPEAWTEPPVFPSGAGGLLSTVDDFFAFTRMLRAGGPPVLSPESVAALTTNHLTAAQVATAGVLLEPQGWGYGLAVAAAPDEFSATPGRYGWDGGSGCVWFTDPHRDVTAIALTQTSDFLFDGGRAEFTRLALSAVD